MIEEGLSGLRRSVLRDYEGDARIHRVWARLEPELAPPRPRLRPGLVLAPAFGMVLFVAGVLVGRTWLASPRFEPELLAEVASPVERSAGPLPPVVEPRVDPGLPRPTVPRRPTARHVGLRQAPSAAVVDESPTDRSSPVPSLPTAPPALPEWLRLAELGDFSGAQAALGQSDGFSLALEQASPEELLILVDVARASGNREQALLALHRLLERSPGAPEAPLAAWTLGNMLEQDGDRAGAAEAFELYRRLSPTGDFAEDAAARQVHAALAQRDPELAARLLEQYAKDFPNGRRLDEFREELGKLEAEPSQIEGAELQPDADQDPIPSDVELP